MALSNIGAMGKIAPDSAVIKSDDLIKVIDSETKTVIWDEAREGFLDVQNVSYEMQGNRLVIYVHS